MDLMYLTLCAFIYTVLICFFFYRKEKVKSLELSIYGILLTTTVFSLLCEQILFYLTIIRDTLFYMFLMKLLLMFYLLWTVIFVVYVISISHKQLINKKYLIPYSIVNVILVLVIFILPIEFYYDGSVGYSHGAAVDFLSVVCSVYSAIISTICIIDFKKIKQKKYLPVILLLGMLLVAFIIQKMHPEILLINFVYAITVFLMYFTIENPDMKMLAEVSAARDQADKANRAKSDFLSSMSHEIRTPLNAIVGLSEDIASYIDQVPPEVVEDTKDIQNASQTLLEIVGNILDISKIESNKMEIVNGPYNLKEEIEGLCKVTSTRIGDKPIDYTLTIADDVPYELIGDKGKVKEIVNNLFTNSIKYTEKGQINLSIRCVNDFANMYSTIYITCQDTGRGIKAESISRLFEKFDRLDVERNTTTEGTGLGLAITKKVIEMMGGKINVSSQFGVGSIFMVAIPQKISKIARPEGENELSETSQLANSNFDLGKRRVLIVDDNNSNIKVAIKALKDFNFDLDSCHSGQECLDKVAAGEHYDLILMDIMMPGMSGDTTLHKLQETGNFSIPVIALTADAIAGAKEKYISAGFVDYIAKPFSRDQIKGKLEKIFIKGNNQ